MCLENLGGLFLLVVMLFCRTVSAFGDVLKATQNAFVPFIMLLYIDWCAYLVNNILCILHSMFQQHQCPILE